MRVALTADLQLQSQPRYSTIASSGITTRLEDFVACFEWIVETAVARSCESLFVLGDVFDSRTVIDVSVIDTVCRMFAEASKSIRIHLLVGNHDAYLRTPRMNSLQMLRGSAELHEKVEIVGDFVVVPWTDDAETYRRSLRRADKMRRLRVGKDRPRFLLSHGMFEGAVPMAKGLPIEWLQRSKWSGVFLGDVHEPVVLREQPVIRYVGSPMQLHFGDAGQERGFVLLDTSSAGVEFCVNHVSPRFHLLKTEDDLPTPSALAERDHARDFFRVRAETSKISDALSAAARQISPWVEVEAATSVPKMVARIQGAGSLSDKQLLRAYCKQMNVNEKSMVKLGLSLLREARA